MSLLLGRQRERRIDLGHPPGRQEARDEAGERQGRDDADEDDGVARVHVIVGLQHTRAEVLQFGQPLPESVFLSAGRRPVW